MKKTGNRQDGEDLAQEVLMQVFVYLSKENKIRKMDNFIWKVAHHCWYNYLRKLKRVNEVMPLDETMPAESDVINELVGLTSIPRPYLESELDWLTQREFLDLKTRKYSTSIPIIGKKHKQNIDELDTNGAWKKLFVKVI